MARAFASLGTSALIALFCGGCAARAPALGDHAPRDDSLASNDVSAPKSLAKPHRQSVCTASIDPVSALEAGDGGRVDRDPASVQRTVRASAPEMRACHDRWALAHPGDDPLDYVPPENEGWPKTLFVIDARGHVTEASVKCVPDEVRACVEGVLLSLEFGAASGTTTVAYP
jgi:hypothetical protein